MKRFGNKSNPKNARLDIRVSQDIKEKVNKDAKKYKMSVSEYTGELIRAEGQSRTMREKTIVQSLVIIQTQVLETIEGELNGL